MKWFNGLTYDDEGDEVITPLFKAIDANAAFQHVIDTWPWLNAVDVIYMGEENE